MVCHTTHISCFIARHKLEFITLGSRRYCLSSSTAVVTACTYHMPAHITELNQPPRWSHNGEERRLSASQGKSVIGIVVVIVVIVIIIVLVIIIAIIIVIVTAIIIIIVIVIMIVIGIVIRIVLVADSNLSASIAITCPLLLDRAALLIMAPFKRGRVPP